MESLDRASGDRARSPGAAVRLVLGFAAAAGSVFLLTRLALLVQQRQGLHARPGGLVAALAMGEVHDLLVAAWLVLPLALYLALVPARVFRWRGARAGLWRSIRAA